MLTAACAGLTACGGDQNSGNAVQMKDLEVVDGTTSDAMTDLDGVQSDAPAPALPGTTSNSVAAPAAKPEPAANAAATDTEVLSDQ